MKRFLKSGLKKDKLTMWRSESWVQQIEKRSLGEKENKRDINTSGREQRSQKRLQGEHSIK
jgi:hypothetical protein